MKRKSLLILTLAVFLTVLQTQQVISKEEFRVRGGRADDFKDSKGRIWYGAQQTKQAWGGWIEQLPQTAEVAQLTDDAKKKAKAAGYDEAIFYAVSWAAFPVTVKYQINTGNGLFDVTYLVGEHWSPNNRGYDIFIEEKNVQPLYVTPGNNEIDIKKYDGIEVKDKVMDFHFAGNPKTGKGDLNAMFSGLEVIPSAKAVDPKQKLTTTWGEIKNLRQN
jgi:hypothetical protein